MSVRTGNLMPRRRKRRIQFGGSSREHIRRHNAELVDAKSSAEQGERLLANGLCRQATDALLSATGYMQRAAAHARYVKLTTNRGVGIATRIARLRRRVLDTCTRDD